MFDFLKRPRRVRLRNTPLTAVERAIVAKNAPYVAGLDDAHRAELEGLVRVFLHEKSFEGCGGLALTDEMRVTIAAHACRLLLHRDTQKVYPELDVILVYPSAFRVPPEADEDGVVSEDDDERVGESWTEGVVVLAWDEVLADLGHPLEGRNVVLHEFAHQLDAEDGAMNGMPNLGPEGDPASWARVFGAEFEKLWRTLDAGRRSAIDEYAATDLVEFFAVVTEMFFEKPSTLKRRHPDLYGELTAFYRQDPAASEQE
jgi:Mlc titration factor MtfA (ptsG expression regulator)